MNKQSIYGLTIDQLAAWLEAHGEKKSRAKKVWEYLYRKRVTAFSEMTEINEECVQLLVDNFEIQTLQEHIKQESADGTIKFVESRVRTVELLDFVANGEFCAGGR